MQSLETATSFDALKKPDFAEPAPATEEVSKLGHVSRESRAALG